MAEECAEWADMFRAHPDIAEHFSIMRQLYELAEKANETASHIAHVLEHHPDAAEDFNVPEDVVARAQEEHGGKWKCIGHIGVDTGQVLITDPCYVLPEDSEAWQNIVEKEEPPRLTVLSETAYGDGTFPVDARVNDEGRVMELRIDFNDASGMVTEAEAEAMRQQFDDRLHAADEANKKKSKK
jgi:hypothetical protein